MQSSLSVGAPPSRPSSVTLNKGGGSKDLNNSEEKIQRRLAAIKTFNEVSQSEKDLVKNAGNSFSKSNAELSTQLNKIKDYQKRFLKDPPNSTDKMLDFLGTTKGNGLESLAYLKKKVLEVAVKIEPTIAAIVKEQTIKALGCSQEQKYTGFNLNGAQISPLSTLPQADGIYIPVESIDFFSNLKNSPDTPFGKMFYEKPIPSADPTFKPYGGKKPFPMNKQMYQIMETQNLNKSYSQINGKNYLGKSGQNLFDFQYTKQNSFGVTGDYFRMLLLNRENDVNNVGEFLSDYYSTIKLIDPVDVAMQLTNIVSGAININSQIGIGEVTNQSQFMLIAQRVLGLCFDSRQEIDVSGTAKIAELDGVDDSFFEFTEVDLRNIDIEISNVQNGVMEFVDCNNVKLPVDSESLVSQIIDFRDDVDAQTTEQQVNSINNILNSISQNPQWAPLLPSNFNAGVAIDKNIIKKIPLAVAAGVLSPKVLLPLYTLLSVVQSGATYTYNQQVTTTNEVIQSGNSNTTQGSNIVADGKDFLKKYKKFSIDTISLINNEFLKVLFDELKKDILLLVAAVLKDVNKSQRLKRYAIILKLIQLALIISQLVNDYRKCKSLMSNILLLLDTINGLGPKQLISRDDIPAPLLYLSQFLPGYSPERATINTIELLQGLGIPTGTLPDGSPNLMLLYNLMSNKGADTENAENGKIQAITTDGFNVTGKSR
jgi:hypothetical protein